LQAIGLPGIAGEKKKRKPRPEAAARVSSRRKLIEEVL
jgi:hypothetical protein